VIDKDIDRFSKSLFRNWGGLDDADYDDDGGGIESNDPSRRVSLVAAVAT